MPEGDVLIPLEPALGGKLAPDLRGESPSYPHARNAWSKGMYLTSYICTG